MVVVVMVDEMDSGSMTWLVDYDAIVMTRTPLL